MRHVVAGVDVQGGVVGVPEVGPRWKPWARDMNWNPPEIRGLGITSSADL